MDNESGENSDGNILSTPDAGFNDNLRRRLKSLPLAGAVLKFAVKQLRKVFQIIHEIRHLFSSFRFLSKLDMILVSGGGQLDEAWGGPWGHPYVLFRWAVLAKAARKRFAVLSVGVGELESGLSKFFTKTALSLANYRSYRDEGSKKLLEKWAFTKNDPCVPDLAFGLRLPRVERSAFSPKGRPKVAICPIAFGHNEAWPKPAPRVYEHYLTKLAEFTGMLAEKGYQVVLFKSSGADRLAIQDLRKKLQQDRRTKEPIHVEAPGVETLADFIREIGQVDLVIASRLHSVILGHMHGKPVLAISFDRKVDTHMRDVEQADQVVDIQSFSIVDLANHFNKLVDDMPNIQKGINGHVNQFKELLEWQYAQLGRLLKSSD